MAREIDFESLDDDDIRYLRARSYLVDEAELQGFEGVRKQVEEFKDPELEPEDVETIEGDGSGLRTAGPISFEGEPGTPNNLPDVPPSEEEEEDDEEDEEEIPYSEGSKEDLQAEAKRRGLPTTGTKADLVKRLEEDDATQEE